MMNKKLVINVIINTETFETLMPINPAFVDKSTSLDLTNKWDDLSCMERDALYNSMESLTIYEPASLSFDIFSYNKDNDTFNSNWLPNGPLTTNNLWLKERANDLSKGCTIYKASSVRRALNYFLLDKYDDCNIIVLFNDNGTSRKQSSDGQKLIITITEETADILRKVFNFCIRSDYSKEEYLSAIADTIMNGKLANINKDTLFEMVSLVDMFELVSVDNCSNKAFVPVNDGTNTWTNGYGLRDHGNHIDDTEIIKIIKDFMSSDNNTKVVINVE